MSGDLQLHRKFKATPNLRLFPKSSFVSGAWWYTSIILALRGGGGAKPENLKFKASWG